MRVQHNGQSGRSPSGIDWFGLGWGSDSCSRMTYSLSTRSVFERTLSVRVKKNATTTMNEFRLQLPGSGGYLFGLRRLSGCRVSFQLKLVDLADRIGDGGFGIRPRKADFERRKQDAIDNHGFQVRAGYPGMPQASSRLKGFDPKAVMVALHGPTPR